MDMPKRGSIGGLELTVQDAEATKDFYAAVCGWKPQPQYMGDYADFNMLDADGNAVAGVCHARGANINLPRMWLPYVVVASLENAVAAAEESGGTVLEKRVESSGAGMAVVQDPAGACFALWQFAPGV